MSMIRQYSWQDWINIPTNKALYNSDAKEGMRQFTLEQQRRNKIAQAAVFTIKGNV